MKKTKFITTSIAYPNAKPHMGYALELIQADFLARYYRMRGENIRLLTGVDEHGLKIQQSAEKAGVGVSEFVKDKSLYFSGLVDALNVKCDRFISTEDVDHIAKAQEIWTRCLDKGDIYKKRYLAWYNVKEEEFIGVVEDGDSSDETERVRVAQSQGVPVEMIELIDEENYFFALSKYQDRIINALNSGECKIVPENRKLELLNFVSEKGLLDVSVSRSKEKLSWGIAVPGDEKQVIYVWFDALINYLTGAVVEEESVWPADIHIVGKDIARFHALMWLGMLMSADEKLPKEILVHGFITSNNKKMSKSLGNVIDPMPIIEKYGADSVRWFNLKEMPTTDDGDFTIERFEATYQSDLANEFGNLVSRVFNMVERYNQGVVPNKETEEEFGNVEMMLVAEKWSEYFAFVEERHLDRALEKARELVVFCNRRIDESKPWEMAKSENNRAELMDLLYKLLELIRHITLMLYPVMPISCDKIKELFGSGITTEAWNTSSESIVFGGLKRGEKLSEEKVILFPRLSK